MVHDLRSVMVSGPLKEAILWVSGQSLVSTQFEYQLRSPQLKPQRSLGENITDLERQHLVSDEVRRRANLLTPCASNDLDDAVGQQVGRLLLYYPEENVSDGASESASRGFFDPLDEPPWDLWLSYERGELISWVPEIWIALAQRGIDANPVDCLQWAGSAFTLKPSK
jgi:hypothetical protein